MQLMLMTIASVSGTGGAGIMIPVMMGLYHFDAKSAVGISNASLFAASFLRYLHNLRLSHPLKNGRGVVIDYNFCTLGLPSAIIGINAYPDLTASADPMDLYIILNTSGSGDSVQLGQRCRHLLDGVGRADHRGKRSGGYCFQRLTLGNSIRI